jgi:hypothetical protein
MRLEELQKQRKADNPTGTQKSRAKQQQKSSGKNKSNKSNKQGSSSNNAGSDDEQSHKQGKAMNSRASVDSDTRHNELMMESLADVEFSSLTANSSRNPSQAVDFGKPGTKMKRLKRLLDEAESKRRRLEVLSAAGEDGKAQALNEQWSDALKDVSGENTVIDAKKIRKAIKKKEKGKEKSAREWAVRRISAY